MAINTNINDKNIEKKEKIGVESQAEARGMEKEKGLERNYEKTLEKSLERPTASGFEQSEQTGGKTDETAKVSFTGVGFYDQEHAQRQKEIEDILSDGLGEIYVKMPPAKQAEFKHNGEQTAREINKMIDQVKFKIKKILQIIKGWLSLVPGINKFYLEQEAKIKTDKIVQLIHEKKRPF